MIEIEAKWKLGNLEEKREEILRAFASNSSSNTLCFPPLRLFVSVSAPLFVCFSVFQFQFPFEVERQKQQQQNRRSSNFMGLIFVEKHFISQTNNSLSLSLHFHLTWRWQNVKLQKMFRARAKVQVLFVSFLYILRVLSEQKTCTLQVKRI